MSKPLLSDCCQSSIHVNYANEGTNYYVCDECNRACDPATPPQPTTEQELKDKFDEQITTVYMSKDVFVYVTKTPMSSFIYTQIQQAVQQERERCLECVGKQDVLPNFEFQPYLWSERNARNYLRDEIRTKIKEGK